MKKHWFRRFIKFVLVTLNVLLVLAYLIGCLIPWLSPQYFWLFCCIGIGFPYIFLAMVVSMLFWLFIKRKYALILLLLTCLGYKQMGAVMAFNSNTIFKPVRGINNIRIVSWNIGNMSGRPQNNSIKRHSKEEIISFLLKQNADVICLQEFEECKNGCKTINMIKEKYPYYFFPGWITGPYRHHSGSAIFSRFPITESDSMGYENGENIIKAYVTMESDTIGFFTTHFDSYKFSREEFKEIDAMNDEERLPKKNAAGILRKLKHTLKTHDKQAATAIEFMNNCNYPTVFCADMNEVPNSYTYWNIRNNRQDAFLQKGFGLGKTFNSLSPALRIDYIMPDTNFVVTQFDVKDEAMSDHSLLVTDVVLKKYVTEKSKH